MVIVAITEAVSDSTHVETAEQTHSPWLVSTSLISVVTLHTHAEEGALRKTFSQPASYSGCTRQPITLLHYYFKMG